MSNIYVQINGQQAGPYDIEQVRRLLAENKIAPTTLAWREGLAQWVPLSTVMAASPPPAFATVPPPASGKAKMSGCLVASIILGSAGFVGIFIFALLAGIAMGPITEGIKKAKESAAEQQAREIAHVMHQYAIDHQGTYPDGATSTEVFQKLIDGNYVSDPGIFYIAMPGKSKATSGKLTSANVCFDVSAGPDLISTFDVPIVFSTGYIVTYTARSNATPDPNAPAPFPGIAIAWRDSWAFLPPLPDGSVPSVISQRFNHGTTTYRQLKP